MPQLRVRIALASAIASILLANLAAAQLRLVPKSQYSIAYAPQFLSAVDFNGDRFLDVVAASAEEDRLIVLFASGQSTFRSSVIIPLGQGGGRVVAGDVNGDLLPDIVSIDSSRRGYAVVLNEGGGRFRAPILRTLPNVAVGEVDVRPVDVAIGRFSFDGKSTTAVARTGLAILCRDYSGRHGDRIYLRDATQLDEEEGQQDLTFAVGDHPRRILVGDLDGDALDEIVVLHGGDAGRDVVSVFVGFDATPEGRPPAVFAYPLGPGAVAMTSGDFNTDGTLDILVVAASQASADANRFAAYTLLNTSKDSKGYDPDQSPLRVLAPVDTIPCPVTLEGIPIRCRPTAVSSGDFDLDGAVDYAVSIESTAVNVADGRTKGLIVARMGVGDGTFDGGTSLSVGHDPEDVVGGDFNGDGIPDLVVAENRSRTVRVVESSWEEPPPPPFCRSDRQCLSGHCFEGQCCATASCPSGMKCDLPTHYGVCAVPNRLGLLCLDPEHCASGNCVGNFCCEQRFCPAGQFCNSGACAPPAGNGTACNQDEQCASSRCTDGVCCAQERCAADQACNLPGLAGECASRLPNSRPCAADGQCQSGNCTEAVCCEVAQCQPGLSCAVSNREGRCVANPPPVPTTNPTYTPAVTPSAAPSITCTAAVPTPMRSHSDSKDGCTLASHCEGRGGGWILLGATLLWFARNRGLARQIA